MLKEYLFKEQLEEITYLLMSIRAGYEKFNLDTLNELETKIEMLKLDIQDWETQRDEEIRTFIKEQKELIEKYL